MKILLLAGEESGMMYRERIAAKVGRLCPGAEIRGYGDYGFNTGDLAVMGILAVLRRIFFFMRVKRTMQRAIKGLLLFIAGYLTFPSSVPLALSPLCKDSSTSGSPVRLFGTKLCCQPAH